MKYGYVRPVIINDDVIEQKKKISIYTNDILEET
ncbi:TPA: resolvase, partial [Staphylococcus aureus]|nr:resolvase [Staphylococcus aureus]